MTSDSTGLWLLLLIFVVAWVLIAQAVEPQDSSELRPRLVKTIAVNVDDEIDRQLDWVR